MDNILVLSISITAILFLLYLLIFSTNKTKHFILSSDANVSPEIRKVVNLFGGDIAALLPTRKMKKSSKISKLLKDSNNPWNITVFEFNIIRFTVFIFGTLLALVLSTILYFATQMLWVSIVVMILLPLFSFFYTQTYHENIILERRSSFRANFPEAIDYLTMALAGGGYSLPTAFEKTLYYLPDGIVRDEFQIIVNDLQTGKTMEMTLNNFADRAPVESIKAFVKALNNANKLSVNIIDILQQQSYNTRKELELEIEKRVQALTYKVMLILSPASTISILLIAVTPSIMAVISMMK